MSEIFYGVEKAAKAVTYAGPVPHNYGTVAGLDVCDYATSSDLTWAGYPNYGFVTEADALAIGVSAADIAQAKEDAYSMQWATLEPTRSELIQAQQWRIDRHSDEVAQNLPLTEDIGPVLAYRQAIRDLPDAFPNPFDIVWPIIPPVPPKA